MFTPSVYSTSSSSCRSHLSLYSASSQMSSSSIFSNTCFIDPKSGFMNSTRNGSFNIQNNYDQRGFQHESNFNHLFTNGCNIGNSNNSNNSAPAYFKMNPFQNVTMPFFENYSGYQIMNDVNNELKKYTDRSSTSSSSSPRNQISMNKISNIKNNDEISKKEPEFLKSSNKQHDTNEDYIKKIWSSIDIDKNDQKTIDGYSNVNNKETKINMIPRLPRPIVKSKFQPIDPITDSENKSQQIIISGSKNGCLRPKSMTKTAVKVVQSPKTKERTSTSSLSSISSTDSANSSFTWSNSSKKSSSSSSPSSSSRDRQLPLRSRNVDLSKFLNNGLTNSALVSTPNTKNIIINNSDQASCSFCKNNGEKEEIYLSHSLKDSLGKIVCPILREYVCPKCGESGDYAHTNKYCPETQRKHKESKIKRCFNQ